jgi:preprotein translocase subunit SecF
MNLFPYDSKIDFMRLRYIAAGISIALLLVAIGAIAFKGLNFAQDFTGGALVEVEFEKPVELAAVREALDDAGIDGATVQNFGTETSVVVRLRAVEQAGGAGSQGEPTQPVNAAAETPAAAQPVEATPAELTPAPAAPAPAAAPAAAPQQADADAGAGHLAGEKVMAALAAIEGNKATLKRSDYVGPQVGAELAENGIVAVLFVAIGFLIYISARFEWKFALAAILATAHDVVVVVGFFALTQMDFDLVVLAGVLSVMGYSINDTIVVFDRVRENFRAVHKATPSEILNRSVNQTLSRTIITSFVALLTVLALYFYGGTSLQGMALSQILGIVIGTLSSIFFACPLLLWLGVSKRDLMPKARDTSELERRP